MIDAVYVREVLDEMAQFTVLARLTFQTTLTIEADDAAEADAKLGEGYWVDDGMAGAELVDWEATGSLKQDDE